MKRPGFLERVVAALGRTAVAAEPELAAQPDDPPRLQEADPAALGPEHRALLDRLAAGDTIAAAAAAEFLSLRTANRRMAQARALFGVRTTREAVQAYLRVRDEAD
jgi:hypothetical protein